MLSATEFWEEKFGEYPKNDMEKLAVAMMAEYALRTKEDNSYEKLLCAASGELAAFREWAADHYGEGYHDMVWEEWEKYHAANYRLLCTGGCNTNGFIG